MGYKNKKNLKSELKDFFITTYRYLAYAGSKHPLIFILIIVFTVIEAVMPALIALINARMFDELINIVGTKTFLYTTNPISILSTLSKSLIIYLGLYILILIISGATTRLSKILRFDLQKYLEIDIEVDIAKKLSSLDIIHFETPNTNDLINKVTTKSKSVSIATLNQSINIIGILTNLILHSTILISLSPLLILVVVALSIPESIVYAKYSKKILSVWNSMTEKRRDATTTASYLYDDKSLKEIRFYNSVEYFIQRYVKLMKESLTPQIDVNHKRSIVGIMFATISSIGYGFILLILFTFVLSQIITIGTFTFYVNSINKLQDNVKELLASIARMYEDSIHTQYVFELLDLKNVIKPGSKNLNKKEQPPLIKICNIGFTYPNTERAIFEGLNIEIKPGEHIAIVGENGAGKTTLIKLLLRLYDPGSGTICIDNTDIKELDINNWYSHIAVLFQDYNFYHFDAKTNIGIGKTSSIDNIEAIKQASKLAGAHDFIKKYDHEYDQILKKSFTGGIDPSIGQQQRIALSRVFLKDAPILILDEPTSAIDPKSEYEIFERLFEYAQNKTVIIVSHRFSTVRKADRIIVMEEGKIVEQGSHEQLLKIESGRYKTAFNLQKRGYE